MLNQGIIQQTQQIEGLLLASLMQSANTWEEVFDILAEDDFSVAKHKIIFSAIAQVARKNDSYDSYIVAEQLKSQGNLEKIGGVMYIARLLEENPSTAHVKSYAEIVKNASLLRKLGKFGENTSTKASHPEGKKAKELIADAEEEIFQLNQYGKKKSDIIHISSLAKEISEEIERNRTSDSNYTGIPSGFKELDEKILGLNAGNLIVIAARPSQGKTALALNIAQNVAQIKLPVLFFSMEMSAKELTLRVLAGITQISHTKLKSGKNLTAENIEMIDATLQRDAEEFPLYIEDDSALKPIELLSLSRMVKRKHQLKLIIVDYIQLMNTDERESNRVVELSKITRSLKHLAKELEVPVIALSQVSREVEKRGGGDPRLSDLRDSGSIEQDADTVIFIQQEDKQNQRNNITQCKLLIEKHRHGATGYVDVEFNRELVSFYSLEEDTEYDSKHYSSIGELDSSHTLD